MSFDFPASPSEGQIFSPAGGPTYIFRAPTWQVTGSSGVPSGAVQMFAMNTPPTGWLKANGALLNRVVYSALFAAIGTTFGAGDGSTTFALPDLRGEFLRSWADNGSVDSGRAFASPQTEDFKSHAHTFTGSALAGHSHTGNTGGVSANHTHSFSDSSSATGTGSANHTHAFSAGTVGGGNVYPLDNANTASQSETTTSTGAAHTHTVAVSGTTGANSVGHTHAIPIESAGTPAGTIANQGGAETRPRNIALLACIKY